MNPAPPVIKICLLIGSCLPLFGPGAERARHAERDLRAPVPVRRPASPHPPLQLDAMQQMRPPVGLRGLLPSTSPAVSAPLSVRRATLRERYKDGLYGIATNRPVCAHCSVCFMPYPGAPLRQVV